MSIENILIMGEPCKSGGLGGLCRVRGSLWLSPIVVPSDPPWIFRFGIMWLNVPQTGKTGAINQEYVKHAKTFSTALVSFKSLSGVVC